MTYRSQLPPKLEEIRAQERKRRGITESGDYGHADAVDGSQSTIQCTIHRCTNLLVRDDMQCEPYVVLKKGPLWEARTATRNSRNAVWEEQFTVPLASQYPLEINVFDVKTIAGSSSFIGGYVFEPEEMSKYPTGRPFSIKLLPHRYETNAAFRLLDDLGEITISWDYHSTKQSVGKNSTSNYSNTASSSSNSIDHSISNSTNDNGNHVTKSVTENGLQSQPVTIILSFYYATGLPAHTQSEYFLRVLTQEIEGVTTPVPATHSIAEWQQELKVYTPNLHVPIPLYLVRADPLTNGVALGGAMLDVQHMPAEGEAQIPISSSVSDNIFPNKTAQDPWAHVMLGWHIQANELVSNSTEVIPHNSLETPQQSVSRSSEVGDASERSYRLTIHVQSGVEFVSPSCAIMIRHNGFEGRTLSQAGHNPTYDQEVVFPSCETQLPVEVFLVDGNTSTVYGCGAFMFSSYHKGQKEEVICYAGSGPPSVHTMNPRVAQSTVGRIALTWRCQDPKSVPSPLNHSEEKNRTDNMPKQDQRPSIMQQQRALVTRGAAAHSPLIETNMAPDSQRSRQVQSQQHYPLRSKTLGARPKISASRQPFVSNASSAKRKLLPSSENHEAKQSPRVIATVQGKRGMTPQIQSNTTPFRTPIPPRYSVESHISQTSEQQYTTEHGLPNSTLMIPSNSRTQVEHFSRSSTGSMTSKATAPGEQNQMLSATSIAKSRDLSPGGANLRIRAADRQVHSSIRKLSMQDGMTPLKIIGSNGVHTAVPPSVNTAFFRAGPPRPGDMKTRGDVNEAQTQRAVMPVRGGTPSSATYIRSRSAPWANSARGLKPSTPGGTNKFRSRSGITHDVIPTASKYGHHASESYTSDPSAASLSSRGGQIPMRSRPRQLHTGLNVLPARTPVKDTRLITTTSSRPNNRTPIIALSQTTRSHPDGLDETPLFIRPHTGKTVHTNTSFRIRSLNSSTHRQRTGRPGIMRSISAPKAASPQHSLSYMTAKETYNTAPQGSSRTLQAKGKSSILTQGVTGKTSANRSCSEPVKAGKRPLASSLRGNNQRSLNIVKIKSPNKTDMVDASPLSNTSEMKKEIPLQEAHKPLSVDVSEAVHSTQEQTSLYTSSVVDEHNNLTTGLKSLDSYLKRNNTGDQTEVKRGDVTSSQSFHTEVSMHKIKFLENDYA